MNFTQKKDFGVGNTVMCTPGLQLYYNLTGQRVDAYFESPFVKDLFREAPFLTIQDTPIHEQFHSGMINFQLSDYEYFASRVALNLGVKDYDLPSPYVDSERLPVDDKLVVITRGCANTDKRATKDPGDNTYKLIINSLIKLGYKVVMVGNQSDYIWNRQIIESTSITFINSGIKQAVRLIEKSAFVIMNDTGLYHVAGALNKKGLIMWKSTNINKNMSPNKNFIHSTFGNYMDDFRYLIKKNA